MARLYRSDCDTYRERGTGGVFLLTHASLHDTQTWYTVSDSIKELKFERIKAEAKRFAIVVLVCCSIRLFAEHLAAHQEALRASRLELAVILLNLSSLSYKLSEKYRVHIH